MPAPHEGEEKSQYLSRCMAYPEMVKKHPDAKQRYAICNSMWGQRPKSLFEKAVEKFYRLFKNG